MVVPAEIPPTVTVTHYDLALTSQRIEARPCCLVPVLFPRGFISPSPLPSYLVGHSSGLCAHSRLRAKANCITCHICLDLILFPNVTLLARSGSSFKWLPVKCSIVHGLLLSRSAASGSRLSVTIKRSQRDQKDIDFACRLNILGSILCSLLEQSITYIVSSHTAKFDIR